MFKDKFLPTFLIALALSILVGQNVLAQGTTTLRDPLVPGASSSGPGIPAPPGAPPPFGCGPTPFPVTPGQTNGPTFEPWNINFPADQAGLSNSGIGVPIAIPTALPPGVVGPLLTPVVPSAPSTQGAAPPYRQAPPGFINPSQQITVPVGGSYPGTGGYNTTINKSPRGGQVTQQFEEQGLPSILGGGGRGQDILTQFGSLAGLGVINGVPTGNGYNNGAAGTNNDNQLSAIDFGGGLVTKVGGAKIPLGSTIQDYGLSTFYNNGIQGLNANRSTEFGQGIQGSGQSFNRTTDFGCPFQPFQKGNVNPQDPAALLPPKALETNF
jgi:hypothetical protein